MREDCTGHRSHPEQVKYLESLHTQPSGIYDFLWRIAKAIHTQDPKIISNIRLFPDWTRSPLPYLEPLFGHKEFLPAYASLDPQQMEQMLHDRLDNMLLHEAANARQTSDAMKEANDKMSRAMTTAARIMHGRKVSPSDEKELMEFNKDLYAMAKSAAALAEHRRKRDDKEDEKISAENEEARAREAEPKDYSVEETPIPQTEVQMDVSFEEDIPQVKAVGAGLAE